MIRLTEVLPTLTDNRIESMVMSHASAIDTVAHVLEIDPHYLSVQVRLHLPFYSADEIFADDGITVVRTILGKLRRSLDAFSEVQQAHRKANGIDALPINSRVKDSNGLITISSTDNPSTSNAVIHPTPSSVGLEIQRRIHYIHAARVDTDLHIGLHIENRSHPLCYAAFSRLDRSYLCTAMDQFGGVQVSDMSQVAVMTRAYGYNPLPKNAMSKLFDHAARSLRDSGFEYIITALNPFLGFKGSIFSGASFTPFATSPMKYWYNSSGMYSNRRSATIPQPQSYPTPPIIWLVRSTARRSQRALDTYSGSLVFISQEEYDAR